MGTRDPRVDAYIAKAPDFAKPILSFIREAVHKGAPDVVETMKWSSPFFMRKKILASMAAFKEHCRFGFWVGEGGMSEFGQVASLKDLPSEKELIARAKAAAKLDEAGAKTIMAGRKSKPPLETPADLAAALKKNKKAAKTFEDFSPSCRREYIEWITEAKREETRTKRLEQTLQMLAEGKTRNWKYQNC